jgi:hypothetical protein
VVIETCIKHPGNFKTTPRSPNGCFKLLLDPELPRSPSGHFKPLPDPGSGLKIETAVCCATSGFRSGTAIDL